MATTTDDPDLRVSDYRERQIKSYRNFMILTICLTIIGVVFCKMVVFLSQKPEIFIKQFDIFNVESDL